MSRHSGTGYEVVEIHGVRIPIDPRVISEAVTNSIRNGGYEATEAHCVSQVVEPGERLVEIGGGVGFISSLAGLQRRCDSIAVFEANPELVPLIEEAHRLNDVIASVHNVAVVARAASATVPFHICRDLWDSSTLSVPETSLKRIALVPVAELAVILKERRPTILILDVEGGEAELLISANLAGVKKVLVELHQDIIGAPSIKAIFDRLSEQNFAYDARYSQRQIVLFQRIAGG
jgi:FkbM family methyltransferase